MFSYINVVFNQAYIWLKPNSNWYLNFFFDKCRFVANHWSPQTWHFYLWKLFFSLHLLGITLAFHWLWSVCKKLNFITSSLINWSKNGLLMRCDNSVSEALAFARILQRSLLPGIYELILFLESLRMARYHWAPCSWIRILSYISSVFDWHSVLVGNSTKAICWLGSDSFAVVVQNACVCGGPVEIKLPLQLGELIDVVVFWRKHFLLWAEVVVFLVNCVVHACRCSGALSAHRVWDDMRPWWNGFGVVWAFWFDFGGWTTHL